MEKLNLASKLLDRSRRSKFNKIVKLMNKQADNGLKWLNVLPANIDPYTIDLLKADGIKVDDTDYLGYSVFKLTWYAEEK